jgi:hypothetical protein
LASCRQVQAGFHFVHKRTKASVPAHSSDSNTAAAAPVARQTSAALTRASASVSNIACRLVASLSAAQSMLYRVYCQHAPSMPDGAQRTLKHTAE